MRRVAIVYSGGRQWGGIESYLANLFGRYDQGRMQLILVSLGEWELTRELDRIGLSGDVRILSGKRLSAATVRRLRRVVVDEEIGLIVSQGVVANAYGRIAARLTGVPNLTVVHSDLDLDYPRVLTRSLYKLSDRILRPATRNYISVSGYLKDKVVGTGVTPEAVHVVYNGVDSARQACSTAQYPGHGSGGGDDRSSVSTSAPTLSRRTLSLVSAGRLHPVKNFDSLVRAMRLLPDEVRLTIWGEGDERPRLEGLVEELGLENRVRLPGESENMVQALEGGDIYMQPSWSEGCSFAVAEALLHGRPVVVAPYGGLPEQVDDRKTGLVARDGSPEALAEAVSVLMNDPGLMDHLGSAGRRAAEGMYSMDKWLNETTALLCGAVEGVTSR